MSAGNECYRDNQAGKGVVVTLLKTVSGQTSQRSSLEQMLEGGAMLISECSGRGKNKCQVPEAGPVMSGVGGEAGEVTEASQRPWSGLGLCSGWNRGSHWSVSNGE